MLANVDRWLICHEQLVPVARLSTPTISPAQRRVYEETRRKMCHLADAQGHPLGHHYPKIVGPKCLGRYVRRAVAQRFKAKKVIF